MGIQYLNHGGYRLHRLPPLKILDAHPLDTIEVAKQKISSIILQLTLQRTNTACLTTGRGVLELFFDGVCSPRSETLPISKDFLTQKNGWIDIFFFKIFSNRDPFLRGFLLILHFFANFVKWDHPLKVFMTKLRPMSKDFWWKSNPSGWHIPMS